MTDHEIGEMWHYWNNHQLDSLPGWWKGKEDVLGLIREFVEERAEVSYWQDHAGVEGYVTTWGKANFAVKNEYRKDARRDFGIPEEEFKP